jgi:NTP pyrophosphatase (non-canonical NTP hydrolase)
LIKINLNEYQKKARTTCLDNCKNLEYLTLGLVGELGEVSEKEDEIYCKKEEKESILLEVGDVMWYLANISTELKIELDHVWDINFKDNIKFNSLPAFIFASKICEKVKKIKRDKKGVADKKDTIAILKNLTKIIRYLDYETNYFGFSLEDAMIKNIEKLESRKKRGVLKGNGDNR